MKVNLAYIPQSNYMEGSECKEWKNNSIISPSETLLNDSINFLSLIIFRLKFLLKWTISLLIPGEWDFLQKGTGNYYYYLIIILLWNDCICECVMCLCVDEFLGKQWWWE